MAQAKSRFGKLDRIWESSVFPILVLAKLRLFEAGVVSVLVYGCELWCLDEDQMVALKHWCAKCMHRLTGRRIRDENRDPIYPLVDKVRQRRLRWLGHTLRLDEGRLVRVAALKLAEQCLSGEKSRKSTVLMDAPPYNTVRELAEYAEDVQDVLE